MSFGDPQSVTVNSVAQSLPKIFSPDGKGRYQKDDGSYLLTLSGAPQGNRRSYLVRLDHQKLVADAFVAANNIQVNSFCYLVMNVPKLGYTNAEVKDMTLGLTGWATSANLLKVLGGEV